VLDAFDLETMGLPTITICHAPFERAARRHATTLGLPDLPLLIELAPKGSNFTVNAADLAAKLFERVLASLTKRNEG
jgi:hypothetical protein